jgi:hypothetical protein
MRSPRGFLAAVVFLLMPPTAALYQALFDGGFETFIHVVLAAGSLLIASAVFDFGKVAGWRNWMACLFVGAEAAIFLLQGVSHLIQSDSLSYIAYRVLGQRVEAGLGDLFVRWCVAMLLADSRGRTRVLGWAAVSIVVCFEVYKYSLAYRGDARRKA